MKSGTAWVGLLLVVFMFLLVLEPMPARASSPIVFDSSGSPNPKSCMNCNPLTWSHTVGVGSNGILIVGISDCCFTNGAPPTATSVKFGSTALTSLGSRLDTNELSQVELWSLMNPSSACAPSPPPCTQTITVTFPIPPFTGIGILVGGSSSYFNVAGTGTVAANNGQSFAASVTVNANSGDLVVDTLAASTGSGGAPETASTTPPQMARWNSGSIQNGAALLVGAGSDQPASSPVPMTWSLPNPSGSGWALIAVPLTPAATTTTTSAPPIPEYPYGLGILATLMLIGYGLVRRKAKHET